MSEILVIDDDHASREAIQEALEREGYRVAIARSGAEGKKAIQTSHYDLVVTDLVMPEIDGFDILQAAKDKDTSIEVIILTGYGSVETAVDAMKRGAYQYLNKPVNIKELREVAKKALEKQGLTRDNIELRKSVDEKFGFESIIGNSKPIKDLFKMVRQVAPTSASVLITGPSGSGKELIAHALHNNSPRKEHPFFAFNCGALTESLIESELFGHERGAFTGAISDRKGYFQLADSGTLFLDEIGDMPLHTQVKLLRVLENRSFFRVGGSKKIEVDVRVIAATNRDLEEMIKKGEFREDLFYRLNVICVKVPSLSDRIEDIPLLAEAFLEEFNKRHGKNISGISVEVIAALKAYAWPGNIRELRNLFENLVVTTAGEAIELSDLPEQISVQDGVMSTRGRVRFPDGMTIDEIENEVIRVTLVRTEGNKKQAAEKLGMSLRTFHRKVKNIKLD